MILGIGTAELLVICAILFFFLLLMAIPATLSFIVLKRIPIEYRLQKPEMAFLLMIPLFSLFWQFFVYPKISESIKNYYAGRADAPTGDYGASLALWCCITYILGLVPIIGALAGIVFIILLILFFVKVFELTEKF